LGFTLYDGGHRAPPEEAMIQRLISLQLSMAQSALQQGGQPALEALEAQWPPQERGFLRVSTTPMEADKWAQPPAPWREPPAREVPPPAGPRPHEDEQNHRSDRHMPLVNVVNGPNGERYWVSFDAQRLRDETYAPRPMLILNIPEPLVWVAGLGGLLFTGVLAWNLTRPLNRLRA
ncbi:hypothetical protein J5224_34645, partial [Candidatus Symbiopectobacterium sp. NZEC135]|nr:hypothetical protein [Candidatus Symbiopectobacterium sp. NZEC135]